MSLTDLRSIRLDKTQARKLISEIARRNPENIAFSRHALDELKNDNLTTVDVWNVIKSQDARIVDEPELVNGTYRYRLGTKRIMVVLAFVSKTRTVVVTAWRKS